jgi:hypothetical protein
VKEVNLEQTVDDFTARCVDELQLGVNRSLVTLRLVKCGEEEPTDEEEKAGEASPMLRPNRSLATSGVTGTAWLLAFVATPAARVAAGTLALCERCNSHVDVSAPCAVDALIGRKRKLDEMQVNVTYAPSSLCNLGICKSLQQPGPESLPAFFCMRPPVPPPHALPVALTCSVFDRFVHNVNLPLVSLGRCELESACVLALCSEMHTFFGREVERQNLVCRVLSQFLGHAIQSLMPNGSASSARTDGVIMQQLGDNSSFSLMNMVVEVKNELNADPYLQAQRYYQMSWEDPLRSTSPLFRCDCCPALMLEVVGTQLRVSGLASLHANRVQCEPLTPYLHFLPTLGQPAYMERLVVTMRALKIALYELRDHFASAFASAGLAALGQHRSVEIALPYPLRRGGSLRLENVKHFCDKKLLWSAQTAGGVTVCVKACARYGVQVHRLWADAGLAPKLLHEEVLPCGLQLIVMEMLSPVDSEWRMLADMLPAERTVAYAEALAALASAHSLSLPDGRRTAHGDCRGVNVLARKLKEGSTHSYDLRFVDFDWSGCAHEAVYPPLMSLGIGWPDGAVPGGQLEQAHDVALLSSEHR